MVREVRLPYSLLERVIASVGASDGYLGASLEERAPNCKLTLLFAAASFDPMSIGDCSEASPCTVLTPEHLSDCPAPLGVDYRMRLQLDILQLLRLHPETAEWLRLNASIPHPPLSASLLSLFPHTVGAASIERHLTYAMCGVLTSSQLSVAARLVGFDLTLPFDRARGISVIQQLSLICISHLGRFFAREKALALAE